MSLSHSAKLLPVVAGNCSSIFFRASSGDVAIVSLLLKQKDQPRISRITRMRKYQGVFSIRVIREIRGDILVRYTFRLSGQFSERQRFGVSGSMIRIKRNRKRTPNVGRPVSMTAFSVLVIRPLPWFICLAVLVPAGTFSLVSVYSTPPGTSRSS